MLSFIWENSEDVFWDAERPVTSEKTRWWFLNEKKAGELLAIYAIPQK